MTRRPRYGRRSPGGRAGSARRPGIVVRPPPQWGGPAPRLPPCAACFLVLLAPSFLDFPQRYPEEKRVSSLPTAAPPLLSRAPDPAPTPARRRGGGRGKGPARRGGRKGGEGRGSGTLRVTAISQGLSPSLWAGAGSGVRGHRYLHSAVAGGRWRQPDISALSSCSGPAAGSTVPHRLRRYNDSRTASWTEGCGLGDPQ